jgi:hypothetical protein
LTVKVWPVTTALAVVQFVVGVVAEATVPDPIATLFARDVEAPVPNAIELLTPAAASLPRAMEFAPVACAPFVESPPIAIALAPLAIVALAAFPFPP